MKKNLFKKIIVSFVLFSFVVSQSGLIYLGSFLSPKKAHAGIAIEPQGSIEIKKGWNLISPSDETLSSEYLSGCEVASGPWYWDAIAYKYKKTDNLRPMNAYWVRVDEDCTLEIGSEGEGDRAEKSTILDPGWNLISSTSNYNWNQFKGSCELSVSWLFNASGSDYGMVSPRANLEAFRGYWVKVKGSCAISEPVINFSVDDLLAIDDSFYCYLSQGAPADSCDLARIIEKNSTSYCRYYDEASCKKNTSGYFEWQCGMRHEDPAPNDYTPDDPNYLCTDKEGWIKAPEPATEDEAKSDQTALGLDLCNITGSLLSSLLGKFAGAFTGEALVGLFGEDIAKKVQGLVDFYFWLKAHNIDPIELAQNPDPEFFAKHLNDFIGAGVDVLGDLAVDKIRDFIYNFAIEMKIDPGIAQELANFMAFLANKGISIAAEGATPPQDIGALLKEYVEENDSPLIQNVLRIERMINLVAIGLDIESEATQSQIIQALMQILYNQIKDSTNLTEQEFNTIKSFIQFLIENKNLSLKEIIQKNKADMEALWKDYSTQHNITLQQGIDLIRQTVYSLVAEAANNLLDIVQIDVEIDGEMVKQAIDDQLLEKAIKFVQYLIKSDGGGKGLDFSQISVDIEAHFSDWLSAWMDDSGITVEIDSQKFLKEAAKFIADNAVNFFQENLNIDPTLSKYIFDFLGYMINSGSISLSTENFVEIDTATFMASFKSYLTSRGEQLLTQIVTDIITPYVNEVLAKLGAGIDPQVLAEIARFAKFLMETKNFSLEDVGTYAKDRIEELLIEFSSKQIEKLTGVPYPVLQRMFKIVINQNLIQDIVHLDLMAIVKKLFITVEINGNFACPTDLMSAICTLLNGNNWESCSVGSLYMTGASSPPHTVKLYDPNIRAASVGICSVPNIYISILGEPIIQGINIKVGPIAYRGTKLRLDMPTSNTIDWKDGSEKDSLYKASSGDGLYHSYSSGGNKNIFAKCRFWLNIDIDFLSFHWPTVTQKVNKNISAP